MSIKFLNKEKTHRLQGSLGHAPNKKGLVLHNVSLFFNKETKDKSWGGETNVCS